MSEYSVEEVLAQAALERRDRGDVVTEAMLHAYAERIKADESAVPALVYLGCNNGVPEYRWNCRWNELEAGTEFYTRPPAQAAQADESAMFAVSRSVHSYYTRDPEEARQAAFDGAQVREIIMGAPAAQPVAQGEVDELFNTFRLAYYGSNKSLAPELESFRRAYRAIAAQPRAVPDGWALVPAHPTHAMCEAAHIGPNCGETALDASCRAFWEDCYAAMLAAAPSPGESA